MKKKKIEPYTPPPEAECPIDPGKLAPRDFWQDEDPKRHPFQCGVLIRMLFSALVDPDRLETERFCDPPRAALRLGNGPGAQWLLEFLNQHLDALRRERRGNPSPIDHHRADVLAAQRILTRHLRRQLHQAIKDASHVRAARA